MTRLVGILNLTPDSFSDGGKYNGAQAALAQAESLLRQGASVLDVGAESTRPNATPISATEEWARLETHLPALIALAHAQGAVLSLDTRHAETAARALLLGVDWINDVSGFEDPAMVEAVVAAPCRLVVMHHLGVPPNPNVTLPESADVVAMVRTALFVRVAELEAQGIERARLILDPGLGFGKTAQQSRALIEGAAALKSLGLPLFFGHSRKSFLGPDAAARERGTLEASAQLIAQGVDYLRVHDVAAHAAMAGVVHGA